jgi:hypothetical protein
MQDLTPTFPIVGVDDEHTLRLGAQLREVRALVLLTLPPNQPRLRIVRLRPSQLPARDRKPERSKVLTLEEVVQMRWREVTELRVHVRIVRRRAEESLDRRVGNRRRDPAPGREDHRRRRDDDHPRQDREPRRVRAGEAIDRELADRRVEARVEHGD